MTRSNLRCTAHLHFPSDYSSCNDLTWLGPVPPQQDQPKQYSWSDTSLSPDTQADLVTKELSLDEKISLLHGQGGFGPSGGPTESNGGAGWSNAIPRVGYTAMAGGSSQDLPLHQQITLDGSC